jgi:hypothetical protein
LNDNFAGHGVAENVEVKRVKEEDRIRNPEIRRQKGHEPILAEPPWPRESAKIHKLRNEPPC